MVDAILDGREYESVYLNILTILREWKWDIFPEICVHLCMSSWVQMRMLAYLFVFAHAQYQLFACVFPSVSSNYKLSEITVKYQHFSSIILLLLLLLFYTSFSFFFLFLSFGPVNLNGSKYQLTKATKIEPKIQKKKKFMTK